ncbi:substrate-binding periplasmic protein [Parachitinimonas caeni]|uniref:Transporter substrate-binding domain-containing protein n=1 Tax=Parachitinimonas caeni TaxID=3031301 RepID=A0ABT7DZB5_9NEIS|nr:transporter substrate-binding domain-containing protein [Parachitinimonas caeni]MDK2125169.1 transporter substrate-binding domain-containing protein [Parachitinimonas caeni]
MGKGWLAGLIMVMAGTAQAELLRVGFGTNKPPYIFEAEKRGLEVDIIEQAALRAGYEIEPFFAPLERLHQMLGRGQLDAIATTNQMSGIQAHYSAPYIQYQNFAVALASRRLEIRTIADLGKYSVSAFQRARFLLGSEFQAMASSNPNYREEAQQIVRNRLLYAGRIDVIVGDRRIIEYFNREVGNLVDVKQPLTWFAIFPPTQYQLGCKLATQCERFSDGLQALRSSGAYEQIEKRYAAF